MTVLVPSIIASSNWFLCLSTLPLLALCIAIHPQWRYTRYLAKWVVHPKSRILVLWSLLLLFFTLFILGCSLELYHYYGCPTSSVFQRETNLLATFVFEFFSREKLAYWIMFGDLLFVLRGQQTIAQGDTDSDIAIRKNIFVDHFGTIQNFTSVIDLTAMLEMQKKVYVRYDQKRELVQIYFSENFHGTHADVWLYKEFQDPISGSQWLSNNDRTIRAPKFLYDDVFPLEERIFLNTQVYIPRKATKLARMEYGEHYMTPLVTRLECVENIWNGYTFYHVPNLTLWYVLTLAFTIFGSSWIVVSSVLPLKRDLFEMSKYKDGVRYLDVRRP